MTDDVYDVNTDRAYHHGDLRRALIEAALEALETAGEAPSLREVARRAGVSAMAPYRHFADKAALMAAVRNLGFQRLASVLADADRATDPRQALANQGAAYVGFALDHPALFRLILGSGVGAGDPPEGDGADGSGYDVLMRRVAGLVPPERAEIAALSAWAFAHGLASLALDGRLDDPRAASQQAADYFAGLVARG